MTGGEPPSGSTGSRSLGPWLVVLTSALLGLGLIADQAYHLAATYDEVTYLQVAARWWRTGAQSSITRMGSPLSFWKIQQAPTLWWVDHWGDPAWVDDPITHQARLLPLIRIGASWVWLVGLGVVAAWARSWSGERAMALASAIFALSPNLLAHGALATMELPIVTTSAAILFAWQYFLRTGSRLAFGGSAALGGLAFSCKYTAILIPPLLGAIWIMDLWLQRDRTASLLATIGRIVRTVGGGMIAFGGLMVLGNFLLTGCATLRLSPRSGMHPMLAGHLPDWLAPTGARLLEGSYPQDWVGFATQMVFQRQGGPSYLLGERRWTGWWYYYPVTLAVKVPLACWFLVLARVWVGRSGERDAGRRDWIIPAYVTLFLLVALVGSKRNYGVRYLLPLAPLVIVWLGSLANVARRWRWVWRVGLLGMMATVAAIHPYELSYFNLCVGGPEGGRRVLADSNLDWGQGAVAVARLQADQPEFRDLTWYYFGDTDPGHYGVVGPRFGFDAHRSPANLPSQVTATTAFLAVSASLQWGPWGPPAYFRELDLIPPVRFSADKTVAIYRTTDLIQARARARVRTDRGPG